MQGTENIQQGGCMPELLAGGRHVNIYVFFIKEGMERPVPESWIEKLIEKLYYLKIHVLIRCIHRYNTKDMEKEKYSIMEYRVSDLCLYL